MPYDEDMPKAARLLIGLLVIACFCNTVKAETCTAFDVASIKLNTSGDGGGYPELAPGSRRFTATNQLMVELIMSAYNVSPLQISGIPSAFSRDRYNIEATCEQPMMKEQIPYMLQKLLAERFHLAIHHEQKEQSVYALTMGKTKPKLHESPPGDDKPRLRQNGHSFTFTNATMSKLADVLSQVTGRKVVDKTGLSGQYDFTLSYSPSSGDAIRDATTADNLPESVFTAIREQLGLRLEAQKSAIDSVVIDHLEPLVSN